MMSVYKVPIALLLVFHFVITHGSANGAIRVGFDRDEYQVTGPNTTVPIKIVLDAESATPAIDKLAAGLFSFGVRVGFDATRARLSGVGDISAVPELNFFGFAPGALESTGAGFGAVKGNINSLASPLAPYQGSVLADLSLTNLATGPSTYPLQLGLFNTLGASEQIFLDGSGQALDGQITFGTARVVVGGAAPQLQAGDSDQDLDFDQFDLVRVQVAGKYLSGRPASWGEGDWNGAPGGSPGNPPRGDGLFNTRDIVAAAQAGFYRRGKYAALQPNGAAGDAQTSVMYNAISGELAVDSPAGTQLTSINIDSAAGIFTGDAAQNLGGSFDNDADNNLFKATFGSSFGSLSFGNVAQSGLSEQFVRGDLTVVGSLAGGGGLGDVDLVYVPVPEPTTIMLTLAGLLTLGGRFISRRPSRR
jgi:hypothetical protein